MFNFRYLVKKLFYRVWRGLSILAIALCAVVLLYFIINNVFFNTIILKSADKSASVGNCKSAIPLYKFAGSYYKIIRFDKNNSDKFMYSYSQIANCYFKLGNKDNADKYILKGYEDSVNLSKYRSPSYLLNYLNKYMIEYYLMGSNLEEARKYLKISQDLYDRMPADDNQNISIYLLSGDLANADNEVQTAAMYYKKAYDIASRQTEINSAYLVKSAQKHLKVFEYYHDYYNLSRIYNNVLPILEKAPVVDHEGIAILSLKNAKVQLKLDNIDGAIQNYENAVEHIKRLPKHNVLQVNLAEIKRNLAVLYNKVGNYYSEQKLLSEIKRNK